MCWSNLWANFPLLKCDSYEILFAKIIPLLFIILVVASQLTFTADSVIFICSYQSWWHITTMQRSLRVEVISILLCHLFICLVDISVTIYILFAFLQRLYATIFCFEVQTNCTYSTLPNFVFWVQLATISEESTVNNYSLLACNKKWKKKREKK